MQWNLLLVKLLRVNLILSLATMLVYCVIGCSHNLNTRKRSWQTKTQRSGVIWEYLLMLLDRWVCDLCRINPSLRHRGFSFPVMPWRWLILQLQKVPSLFRLGFCAHLAQCTLSLGSKGLSPLWRVFWPCWSFVRPQDRQGISLSSSVLTCSHLRFKARLGIWSSGIFLIKLVTCSSQNGRLLALAQQVLGSFARMPRI